LFRYERDERSEHCSQTLRIPHALDDKVTPATKSHAGTAFSARSEWRATCVAILALARSDDPRTFDARIARCERSEHTSAACEAVSCVVRDSAGARRLRSAGHDT